MDLEFINGDRGRPVVMHGGSMPWVASPQAGVERRMLERVGAEVALATSIVSYAAGSRFDSHSHDLGEEFLILAGTFSDDHGHYPVGTYVRNPPGSRHRPFSEGGCVIFVKLRQMAPGEAHRVVLPPPQMRWLAAGTALRRRALLHTNGGETVQMELLHPGCTIPARVVAGGEEMLVVNGSVTLGEGVALAPWSWWRNAAAAQPVIKSRPGALVWIKRGHLAAT